MNIQIASHYGLCFGVRDALATAQMEASSQPITILGQLAHNPLIRERLRQAGASERRIDMAEPAPTNTVLITAHGAAQKHLNEWQARGHRIVNTTCPLVHRAHEAMKNLVARGYLPIVIGSKNHVEVVGLTGDYPHAIVIEGGADIEQLPHDGKLGIISQTTQTSGWVKNMVLQIQRHRPHCEVKWVDTICQPTKDRQQALLDLCEACELILVVGGHNSNNSRQLVSTALKLGVPSHLVESADEMDPAWFRHGMEVGLTAGTSTLQESVDSVYARLLLIAEQLRHNMTEAKP